MASRRYDLILFGATGFTGAYCAEYIAKRTRGVNVALAGRSEVRLRELKAKLFTGADEGRCGILVADVANHDSLVAAFSQGAVVLSAVGPYRFLGEAVVRACVAAGADYVDVCGEPEAIEARILDYGDAAAERGVTLVFSAGFDSIPADMGVLYAERQWKRVHGEPDAKPQPPVLSTVQSILSLNTGKEGTVGHYGTWESLIHSLSNVNVLAAIRSKLRRKQDAQIIEATKGATAAAEAPDAPAGSKGARSSRRDLVPRFGSPLPSPWMYWSPLFGYVLRFPGADASVVRQSQIQRTITEARRFGRVRSIFPHYSATFRVRSSISLAMVVLFGLMLRLFTKFSWTRALLLRFPRLFSFGAFSHDGPTEKQVRDTSFEMTFLSKGFRPEEVAAAAAAAADAAKEKPKAVTLQTHVRGPEPGYAATSIMACTTALFLRQERAKKESQVPSGAFTPAGAFCEVADDLISKLHSEGITFTCDHSL
jgi:short subunit dehydrogenase-like uncharacterized protein